MFVFFISFFFPSVFCCLFTRLSLSLLAVSHHGLYLYTRTAEQVRLADEKAAAALKQEEAQAAKKAAAAAKGKAKDAAAAPAAGAKKADDKKADE